MSRIDPIKDHSPNSSSCLLQDNKSKSSRKPHCGSKRRKAGRKQKKVFTICCKDETKITCSTSRRKLLHNFSKIYTMFVITLKKGKTQDCKIARFKPVHATVNTRYLTTNNRCIHLWSFQFCWETVRIFSPFCPVQNYILRKRSVVLIISAQNGLREGMDRALNTTWKNNHME